ncbi:hypothetical protein HanXRQr2_Chr12g0539231 [Helianthus annuus]|uniref:Uncharacterized protein n=1 Tax=Helianthus annuus TaxID=4232 RepID=A0A9K3HG70_HELAN|nr:hypothetical protein HanXRQr2_Chr12g0539231 [Helianthus annuus]KAJ0930187.1 hypothetical protein HanPSC8_Chr04g0146441 [Helianthus annuus]
MFYYVFGYWIQKDRHFILHQASCIWRCKRVGTRKVIHLEIDIYLAYWQYRCRGNI